jgi:hypothetical protein
VSRTDSPGGGGCALPHSSGIGHIDPNTPQFRAADQACQSHLPAPPPEAGQPMTPRDQAQWLQFSACVRFHGVPNFPDPDFTNGGPKPFFNYSGTGVGAQSPTVAAAQEACRSVLPVIGGGAGGNGGSGSTAAPGGTSRP